MKKLEFPIPFLLLYYLWCIKVEKQVTLRMTIDSRVDPNLSFYSTIYGMTMTLILGSTIIGLPFVQPFLC